MNITPEKPTLVIAGPGAGKTHNMVNKIVQVMPILQPNRTLAVITYTNAATDLIKTRLQLISQILPNVFIGTNCSFFNRFIIIPYATIFEPIAFDKLFLDINVDEIVERIREQSGKKKDDYAWKNSCRSRLIDRLLQDGHVPLNEVASLASKLMENHQVRDTVCNRLQYLFIDEFQDTDTHQAKIFEFIRKSKKTGIYMVGDPEQYILGFTYDQKPGRKPKFENIPINKFSATRELNTDNRRSVSEIVDFLNNFHSKVKQVSLEGSRGKHSVFFISDTRLNDIILRYMEISKELESDSMTNHRITRFYLSYENKTFVGCAADHGLVPVSNESTNVPNILGESLQFISSIVGLSQKQICEQHNIDQISYRKLGICLIEAFHSGKITDEAELKVFIENVLGLTTQEDIKTKNQFTRLRNILGVDESALGLHQYTSIHKAKGLEADAVLVVARTENELKKWLTVDKKRRQEDTTDTCRIGFVAFSRAREILCIACVKPIGDEVKSQLSALSVQIV